MLSHAVTRLGSAALASCCFALVAACGGIVPPDPVQQTETFTGTLQPQGFDYKTFSIVYAQSATDLSVTVDSLKRVSDSTAVTGIKIGIGFGLVSGNSCALQAQQPAGDLGVELFLQNGASAGTYCVELFDCPTGATGCSPALTEPVTYSMTVKHY